MFNLYVLFLGIKVITQPSLFLGIQGITQLSLFLGAQVITQPSVFLGTQGITQPSDLTLIFNKPVENDVGSRQGR